MSTVFCALRLGSQRYSSSLKDAPLLSDIKTLLAQALSVERPSRVWDSARLALSVLDNLEVESSYMESHDFAKACAQRIAKTPENAEEILTAMGHRPLFWDVLSECSQEGSVRQLRNIGQSILMGRKYWDGELSYTEVAVNSAFLSAVGNRIRSLYPETKSDFGDDDFLLLFFFTDLSARLSLYDDDPKQKVIQSNIVSSLVQAWARVLTCTGGQAWLDERITFWKVRGRALWEGDTDEARLESLKESILDNGRGKLFDRPNADELLLASHISLPQAE